MEKFFPTYMKRICDDIKSAVDKFNLVLQEKVVLTEAATGNYVVTPVIAAVAGAKVYALAKNSPYGTIEDVVNQTEELAFLVGVKDRIQIIESYAEIDFKSLDVVTNTGHVRPINGEFIEKLPVKCVISLMYEPWEFRDGEIDLKACIQKGIKIYGTDESDPRVRTVEHLGYVVLYLLLSKIGSPWHGPVLLLGNKRFVDPVERILKEVGYLVEAVKMYNNRRVEAAKYGAIVVMEHERDLLLIGEKGKALIDKNEVQETSVVIHVCGNVDFKDAAFEYFPKSIRPFGFMSLTADYIDPKAVVDLHAAGLKVAEGMLKANELCLKGIGYKDFMEKNYPTLAFDDPLYW